jgi:hypothetical protein
MHGFWGREAVRERDERARVRWSELELEGELDGAGAADLVEGVETAVGAAGAEAARQSLRRVTEERIGQVVVGITEVRMIKDVEELGTETEPYPFGEMKLPLDGNIGLRGTETAKDIAPEITLRPRRGCREGVEIENFAAGILRAEEFERHARYKIRPWIQSGAVGKVDLADDVNGRRRSGKNKTVQRPAAQGSPDKRSSSGSGQIVGYARSERMTDVKIRISPVGTLVATAARGVEIARESVGRGIVNRVREGIRSQSLQAPRQTPLELDLKSIVIRSRRIGCYAHKLKICIRVKQVCHSKQIAACRADVCEREALVASERLLQREIPLVGARKL